MSGDSWRTPGELYNSLFTEFDFEFDLCAEKHNTKCVQWSDDIKVLVLSERFLDFTSFWINPPYSRGNISECMEQVVTINRHRKLIVSLTRFDPSADWFKKYVDGVACEVRMLDKRVKFMGASGGYPFPCCVSIYRGFIPKKTNYYIWGW